MGLQLSYIWQPFEEIFLHPATSSRTTKPSSMLATKKETYHYFYRQKLREIQQLKRNGQTNLFWLIDNLIILAKSRGSNKLRQTTNDREVVGSDYNLEKNLYIRIGSKITVK